MPLQWRWWWRGSINFSTQKQPGGLRPVQRATADAVECTTNSVLGGREHNTPGPVRELLRSSSTYCRAGRRCRRRSRRSSRKNCRAGRRARLVIPLQRRGPRVEQVHDAGRAGGLRGEMQGSLLVGVAPCKAAVEVCLRRYRNGPACGSVSSASARHHPIIKATLSAHSGAFSGGSLLALTA